MGRIQAPKTLRVEDFAPDQQEMVGKIAFVINNYQDQIFNLVNGNIDFFNLAQSIRTINVTTNGSGEVNGPILINPELSRRIIGVLCVSARNTSNPAIFPASQPFIAFNSEIGRFTIQKITGLPASSTISLTLLLIGE